jgi:hypothetical protein
MYCSSTVLLTGKILPDFPTKNLSPQGFRRWRRKDGSRRSLRIQF